MLADPSNLFLYRKNQLLKSLDDGLDLSRNAAEYMMAYANLNVKPKDSLSLVCKSMAINILVLKNEGYDPEEGKKAGGGELSSAEKVFNYKQPNAPVAVGMEGLSSEKTRHPWVDKFSTTDEAGIRHAVWPDAITTPGEPYHKKHPFREETYPLLRKNPITKRRGFVERLKRMFLTPTEKEKAKSHHVGESEKKWHDEGVKDVNPVMMGQHINGKRQFLFGGPLIVQGAVDSTNHDLYERDFRRWKLENGHGNIDDTHDLRKEHFNSRADEWEGDDTTFIPPPKEDFSYDKAFEDIESGGEKGTHHGHGLGWASYMLGMEWLSPEERTAVMNHLEENGNLTPESQRIKLSDGTILPAARFAYNAMERITAELNWWGRAQNAHGPNMHKKLESNEKDFLSGENRFLQDGLNIAAHDDFYPIMGENEADLIGFDSVAKKIHEKLGELNPSYGAPTVDEDGEPIEYQHEDLKALPRFEYHSPKNWKKVPESFGWKDIVRASKNHKKRVGEQINPEAAKLSKEDFLFLSGYHPETEEHMTEHPLYGDLEKPVIPKKDVDELLENAEIYSDISGQSKSIRNTLTNKRSRFGVKPEENENEKFEVSSDGTHTKTHANHWWDAYASEGGVGRSLPTYVEFIHNMLMNPETGKSIFGSTDENGDFVTNKNLNSIASIVAPFRKPTNVEFETLADGTKKLTNTGATFNPSYVLSPGDITHTRHDSEGLNVSEGDSIKNNYTDHFSSTSGKYANEFYSKSPKEHKAEMNKKGYNLPRPFNQPAFSSSDNAYGEGSSDAVAEENAKHAHHIRTALGHIRPFEEPQKKLVHSLKSMQSYGVPFSTGNSLQEFLDFIGYSDYRQTSLKNAPEMPEGLEKDYLKGLRAVSRHLGTRNSSDVAQYLNNGDYTDMSAKNQDFITALMGDIGILNPNTIETETPKEAETRYMKDQQRQLSKIKNYMGMGAYGFSMPEESNAVTELMELENLLDTSSEGIISPEDIGLIHSRVKDLRSQVYAMQSEASNMQPKGKSGWWEDRPKQRDAKLEGDNRAIHEMAKILIPQIKEAVPHSFPEDDKLQFLHDSSQVVRLAEHALLSMEHNSHGLKSHAYGIDTSLEESKSSIASGEDHSQMANHLLNHGSEIHGNMTVTEALTELGLPISPEHKEHVRKVINQSKEMNTPLHVSTMNSLLTDGSLGSWLGHDLTPFHGEDYHSLLDEGQISVSGDKSSWKSHALHSIPRDMDRHMNEYQLKQAMQNHGLNYVNSDVNGLGNMKKKNLKYATKNSKNKLDSMYVLNPDAATENGKVEQIATPEEVIKTAQWQNRPISAPTPESHCSVSPAWTSGRIDDGRLAKPTFDGDMGVDGKMYFSAIEDPTYLHTVSHEGLIGMHGKEIVNQVMDLPGVTPQQSAQQQQAGYEEPLASDPNNISTGEMTDFLTSLLNPDVLLKKASEDDWVPLIRPMHRIFSLDDLKEFKGFSDSWIVSTWYEGERLLLVKDDDDTIFLDEDGKQSGVPKKIRDAAPKLCEKDFIVDGILKDDEFFVQDIISYDGTDSSDMNTNERLKILRGQLESHDGISIPGPYNTRVTDRDGLESAVVELKEEGRVLLRDAQSTYMKGEKRHPKWLILREGKNLNFVILDKRGKGPFTYRLGAGPILTNEGLGNRAVELEGRYYMDVGTAHRVEKPFEEGDIVEAEISGVTKKTRGGRDIFNVQFTSVNKEGEGEGPASAESLSLLTKSYPPMIIPHDIDFDGKVIKIMLKDIDIVEYEVKKWNDNWYLQNPNCVMGDLMKSNYSYNLSESLRPFWEPVVSLMLDGYVEKMMYSENEDDEEDAERIEEESAGVLNQKEKNILLKPSMVKALEVALRALDVISKEKMTSSGTKGLGIDMATPVESPSGPTKLRDESTLPDYDMRPRPGEEPEKPMSLDKKGKHRLTHAKLESDEGESIDFDIENDQPTIRFS